MSTKGEGIAVAIAQMTTT